MKNAILLHGSGETPDSYWYGSIINFLKEKGYDVWAPKLPEPRKDTPELGIQLPYVLEKGRFDEDAVLVGHSAGAPLILSILENIDNKVKKAILVAGFARQPRLIASPLPILQKKYSWEKIKNRCSSFFFVNSDNDPYGCNDEEGRFMLDRLGGFQIIAKGEGHFGSNTFKQPYKEFPLIEKLILL